MGLECTVLCLALKPFKILNTFLKATTLEVRNYFYSIQNIFKICKLLHFSLLFHTYLCPLTLCSLPISFFPQWKCICSNSYLLSNNGPPVINGTSSELLASLTQTIRSNIIIIYQCNKYLNSYTCMSIISNFHYCPVKCPITKIT